MANTPTFEARTTRFTATDGVSLAIHEMGDAAAAPVLMVHGLFSDAATNWIKFGHAARLAEAGRRVVMPDLRGHGQSDRPHEASAYPPDILTDDMLAVAAWLGRDDYDLVGYSLGGRTAVRMLARGARPRRAVVAGMGLEGLLDTGHRSAHFRYILGHLGEHPRGSPEWMAEQFLKTTGGDPQALLPLLGSFVDTPRSVLDAMTTTILIVAGKDDSDNGSAAALADVLPNGRYEAVPGNHMSAVTKGELGAAIARFLTY